MVGREIQLSQLTKWRTTANIGRPRMRSQVLRFQDGRSVLAGHLRWLLALVVAFGALGVGAEARAQRSLLKERPADKAARGHLDQGNRYFRALKYDEAIAEYEAGAAIEGHPIFYYNLAQAYRLSKRYEQAITLYERWLARAKPKGALKDNVENLIEQMKAELEQKAATEPPVEPAADVEQADVPAVKSPGEVGEPTVRHEESQPGTPETRVIWYQDWVGWTVLGVGAGAAGVGTGLIFSAQSLDDDAAQEPSETERADLRDRAESRRLFGYATLGVGGIALVAGVVKLVVVPRSERSNAHDVSVWVSPSGVGIGGRF
jgi:tetratricopeptide (TPR) repeat protein